jgi:hypothetical protein
MFRGLRSLFVRKPKSAPRRKSPSPKRRTPSPKRRASPSVRRSAALGPFWARGNYARRQGPLKATF